MKYYYIIEGTLRNNIGDVLQGMVAKQFIKEPQVADRENLKGIQTKEQGLLIANGWYMHSFENFPPNDNINPIYISVHIAQSKLLFNKEVREHFKKHGPIGCRDRKTQKLFLGWGIPAYYSNCMTITAGGIKGIEFDENIVKNDEILIVDGVDHPVPNNIINHLETLYKQPIKRVTHDPKNTEVTFTEYAANAEVHMVNLLNRYKKAKLVITSKIHAALPCLGVGANVLLIHPNPADPRLETVSKYINVNSFNDVLEWKQIPENNVNTEKLRESKKFISDLINNAVKNKRNPVRLGRNLKYSLVYIKSIISSKIYRLIVKLILLLNINVKRVQGVYK